MSSASSAANFQQEIGLESWRQKLYSNNPEANEYKQFSPNISSSFQIDPAAYGSPSSTISTQGTVLGSENQQRPNFLYPANCGLSYPGELSPSLSKAPQYMRNSPPSQQQNSPLQFSSSAVPLWNATSASMNDVRSSSFFPPPTFDEKPKVIILIISRYIYQNNATVTFVRTIFIQLSNIVFQCVVTNT